MSRKLKPAETKYVAMDREALLIKRAIEELRYYLPGPHFTLVTDHAPLQWMAREKDTKTRVTRWFLSLQDFFFQVQHRVRANHGYANGPSWQYTLWAQHPPGVGSELKGGYCDSEHVTDAHNT